MNNKNQPQKEPSRLSYAVGFFLNLIALVLVHQHETWRPWLAGIITERWIDVLWIVDLSIAVQLISNIVLFLWRREWLRHLFGLLNSLMAAASVVVFYEVYPFALSSISTALDVALQIVLLLGLLGAAIAGAVSLVLLLTALLKSDPSSTLRPRESH